MNYISKISNFELNKFLVKNGLTPVYIKCTNGKKFSAIEKNYTHFFVRCAFTPDCKNYNLKSFYASHFNDYKLFQNGVIGLTVTNFSIEISSENKNLINEIKLKLNNNWIDYLNKKFGENYKLDLANYLSKSNKNDNQAEF